MKKELSLFLIFLILPLVSAEIQISKTAVIDVVAKEVTTPAIFNCTITNTAAADENVMIYSLLDMILSPSEKFKLSGDSVLPTQIEAYPGEQLRKKEGNYLWTYFIKGQDAEVKDSLQVRVVSLYNALEATLPSKISVNDTSINLTIKNKENLYIPEARIVVSSALFNYAKTIEIKPNSTQNLEISLSNIDTFEAGQYTTDVSLLVNNGEVWKVTDSLGLESIIKITTKEAQKGWFLYPDLQIVKKNDGNTKATANIFVEKDAFSTLFTKASIDADSVKEIKGNFAYEWHKDLAPGESFVVNIRTNYLLPIIVLALIAAAIIFVWMSTTKPVVLTKRVTKIRTKGGEFAVKVTLFVKSFIDIKNVKIIDLAPASMPNIHNQFGILIPDSIRGKRLEWNFDRVYKGEEKILTYVVYSKLALIGELSLPKAVLLYQDMLDRSKKEYSNQVFFMAEEKRAE